MGKTTLLLRSYSRTSLGQVLPGVTSGGLTMIALQVRKLGLREVKGLPEVTQSLATLCCLVYGRARAGIRRVRCLSWTMEGDIHFRRPQE